MLRLLIVLLFVFSHHVNARMYQWTEPDTGSTQLSGKPPAWYRSAEGGPRILVFENGRLIDDTAVEVEDAVRFNMRQQAFLRAEDDKQAAKDKLEKAKKLKQQFKEGEEDTIESVPIAEEDTSDAKIEAFLAEMRELTGLGESDTETAKMEEQAEKERLRDLVTEWENQQVETIEQKPE